MAVKLNNPRKNFQFRVIIPGMNPFLVQKVKLADVELDANEHGDAGFDVKTAGREKLGTLTVEKLFDATAPSNEIKVWRKQIRNTQAGGGDIPSNYKRVILIEQFGYDGITVIDSWEYTGGWPQKINGVEFDMKGSDNMIQSIEFCVDEES